MADGKKRQLFPGGHMPAGKLFMLEVVPDSATYRKVGQPMGPKNTYLSMLGKQRGWGKPERKGIPASNNSFKA
ncbi:hypothetical protein LPY66_11745 [Dehalobacter sp. DCM]|uniref:hypothetical protein n=1 Tax=Dehalobacter sp. DCM TaxID=2907827 RepID=UPI0030815C7C|nr:hypothetical protein LPY66_11745 [Dehalobacter sp. DCM]